VRGGSTERGGGDAPRKIGQQQAARKLQRDLYPTHRDVVFHAEDAEAGGQKERVAGQPDQGRVTLAAGYRQGILTMQQQVFSQPAIDQRVSIDLKEFLQHPQAQGEARGKCKKG
jgi:hypothetical protein